MKNQHLTEQQVKRAILDSLSPDLLEPKYRAQLSPDAPPETGHCAVATEAFYYLAGGREAGYIPVVCGYNMDEKNNMHFGPRDDHMRRESHWWMRGPAHGERGKGAVIDITEGQFAEAFPYEKGHNTGFMQPQQKPSKRARVVMDRVIEKLGASALQEFRQANIRRYKAPAKSHPVKSLPFKSAP